MFILHRRKDVSREEDEKVLKAVLTMLTANEDESEAWYYEAIEEEDEESGRTWLTGWKFDTYYR
jgi:hypothetical protein